MGPLGWCCYDGELVDTAHLAAVDRLRPDVVRWFCSIDRYVRGEPKPNVDWAARFGRAFDALAAVGSSLVVQWQMKTPTWTAHDAGNTVGAAAWRASTRCGWLLTPDPWITFCTSLAAEIAGHGIPAVYGAWNEPDWRIGWPWDRPANGANPLAPTVPWQEGRWFGFLPVPPSAPFGWSGGHQKLAELRSMLPLRWTSDGVSSWSPDWLALTAADPTVSVIDVHCYQPAVAAAIDYVGQVVSKFDESRPDRLPIVVGEYGEDANGTPFTPGWQARTQLLEGELDRLYPGRVLGMCAHLQGTRGGVTYPALWQVL